MYKGYDLSLSEEDIIFLGSVNSASISTIKNAMKAEKKSIQSKITSFFEETISLDSYKLDTGALDGTKMIDDWFPIINADVFISHSHKDQNLAISLAAWLYEQFGLNSFIDSTVWGYSNDLLRSLDEKYCYNKNTKTFSYEKRNVTTSHVHMMLATALSNMINNSECLFFLNTPNSITVDKEILDNEDYTYSPWLYGELSTAMIVEKRYPRSLEFELRKSLYESSQSLEVADEFLIRYKADLSQLTKLDKYDLNLWFNNVKRSKNKGSSTLDRLYLETILEKE